MCNAKPVWLVLVGAFYQNICQFDTWERAGEAKASRMFYLSANPCVGDANLGMLPAKPDGGMTLTDNSLHNI